MIPLKNLLLSERIWVRIRKDTFRKSTTFLFDMKCTYLKYFEVFKKGNYILYLENTFEKVFKNIFTENIV